MIENLRRLFVRKDFYKNIEFELAVFVLALGVVLYNLLQIPFSADGYYDPLSAAMAWGAGALLVASTVSIRGFAVAMTRDKTAKKISSESRDIAIKNIALLVVLPALAYLLLLPWIFAGVFNTEDMSTIGSFFMILLLTVLMPLLGVVAGVFVVFPIESTVRGAVRMVRTGGKQWGQFVVGLFGLEVLALIVAGVVAIDTDNSGPAGSGQVLAALIGLPGGYEVENLALLWVARVLFIVFVSALLWVRYVGRKHQAKQASAGSTKA